MRPTRQDLKTLGDFATVFQWDVSFLITPPVLGGVSTDDLNLRAESVDVPQKGDEKITVAIRGNKIHQPGIANFAGELPMVFVETTDNRIAGFLKLWRDGRVDPETGEQRPNEEMKGVMMIRRLDRQGRPIWFYKLHGAYLQDDTGGTLDGASSEAFKPNAVVSYDWFEDGPC